jgi:hypothetical protein
MRHLTKLKTIAALVSIAFGLCASTASAKQFTQTVHGKEVIVHTNALPVLLHRMVPPQYGRHVTQREVESGKIPQPAKPAARTSVLPRRR